MTKYRNQQVLWALLPLTCGWKWAWLWSSGEKVSRSGSQRMWSQSPSGSHGLWLAHFWRCTVRDRKLGGVSDGD